jgi:hypothetical protein
MSRFPVSPRITLGLVLVVIALVSAPMLLAGEQPAAQQQPLLGQGLSIKGRRGTVVLETDDATPLAAVSRAATGFQANRYSTAMCGGALVAPRVYLTAAHCVYIARDIRVNGIDAHCQADWDYKDAGLAHDVAACLLVQPITDVTYETIDAVQTSLTVGATIMLTGYGGNSTVSLGVDMAGTTTVTKIIDGLVITNGGTWIRKGGGDSGSTPYSWNDPARRRVIGMNSAEGIGPKESVICSLVPSAQFLSGWSATNHVSICGLNGYTDANCHQ